jgi:hypothetical protein
MKLGRTPLHWAGRNKHVEVFHYLYDITADVDLPDTYGITARYLLDDCRLQQQVEGSVVKADDLAAASVPTSRSGVRRMEPLSSLSLHSISLDTTPPMSLQSRRAPLEGLQSPCSTEVCMSLSPSAERGTEGNVSESIFKRVSDCHDIVETDLNEQEAVWRNDSRLEWDIDSGDAGGDVRCISHAAVLEALERYDHDSDGADNNEDSAHMSSVDLHCAEEGGSGGEQELARGLRGKAYVLKQRALHIRRLTLLLFSAHDLGLAASQQSESSDLGVSDANVEALLLAKKYAGVSDHLSVDDDDADDEEEGNTGESDERDGAEDGEDANLSYGDCICEIEPGQVQSEWEEKGDKSKSASGGGGDGCPEHVVHDDRKGAWAAVSGVKAFIRGKLHDRSASSVSVCSVAESGDLSDSQQDHHTEGTFGIDAEDTSSEMGDA